MKVIIRGLYAKTYNIYFMHFCGYLDLFSKLYLFIWLLLTTEMEPLDGWRNACKCGSTYLIFKDCLILEHGYVVSEVELSWLNWVFMQKKKSNRWQKQKEGRRKSVRRRVLKQRSKRRNSCWRIGNLKIDFFSF